MTNASTPKPALFRMLHLWQGGMVLLLFLSMEPKAMTQPSAADSGSVSVHFSKATLQTILPFYTGVTGKKVILDSTLQGEPLQIIAPQPLTRAEAAAFIEATLLLNGYSITHVDAMTVRLACHASGKSPTPDGLKVFNRLQDLPQTEEICHYVLLLQHISGTEAANLLPQRVALRPYGVLTAIADGAALIITENSTTIRSLCELARLVDSPPTKIENDMIKVEHASVDVIASPWPRP